MTVMGSYVEMTVISSSYVDLIVKSSLVYLTVMGNYVEMTVISNSYVDLTIKSSLLI